MVREMECSGCRFGLPEVSVLIWVLGWVCWPPQSKWAAAKLALVQGSCVVTAESVVPAKNSETFGRRKPWDQLMRSRNESETCHFKAARPVLALVLCRSDDAGSPSGPPSHLNCDQRSARSRSMYLAKD